VLWRLLKTAIFTGVAPGTVGVLLPQVLKKDLAWHWTSLSILGFVLVASGVAVYLWCAWDFAVKGLGTPAPIDAPRVLVVKGLYRFTRNPMYLGVSSVILGQSIAYGSLSIAVYLACVAVAFNLFVLLYEEPTLRQLFGEPYNKYCRKVPRWILPLPRA
jgi:protein-S-isoprenylcysteine O-methyltransferase Ste14